MFKFKVPATMLAIALSYSAISCTGPIFIHPPVAAAPGPAVAASAPIVASGITPLATVSPAGSQLLFFVPWLGFAALGATMFLLRGKAPSST